MQPLALAYLRLIVLHRIFTFYRLQIIQQQLGQLSSLAEEETDDDMFLWYLLWGARYTGQEYDPETGFYYYNARYYDPQLGVFTTPDTEFDTASSFGFNRHMYVGGNPIMYSDPSGHLAWFVVAAIAAAVSATTSATVVAAQNNWDFKNNWGKIGTAFGIGAVAGFAGGAAGAVAASGYTGAAAAVVGGMVGGGVGGATSGSLTAWSQGKSFGEVMESGLAGGMIGALAGAVGGAAGFGGTAAFGDGFWGSVASGAMAGTTGGFVEGYLGARAAGRNGDDALLDGLSGAALGAGIGGALGGALYDDAGGGAAEGNSQRQGDNKSARFSEQLSAGTQVDQAPSLWPARAVAGGMILSGQPVFNKPRGGLAGGGPSGKKTSAASLALRKAEKILPKKMQRLPRGMNGTGSVGGAAGRAVPKVGAAWFWLEVFAGDPLY